MTETICKCGEEIIPHVHKRFHSGEHQVLRHWRHKKYMILPESLMCKKPKPKEENK